MEKIEIKPISVKRLNSDPLRRAAEENAANFKIDFAQLVANRGWRHPIFTVNRRMGDIAFPNSRTINIVGVSPTTAVFIGNLSSFKIEEINRFGASFSFLSPESTLVQYYKNNPVARYIVPQAQATLYDLDILTRFEQNVLDNPDAYFGSPTLLKEIRKDIETAKKAQQLTLSRMGAGIARSAQNVNEIGRLLWNQVKRIGTNPNDGILYEYANTNRQRKSGTPINETFPLNDLKDELVLDIIDDITTFSQTNDSILKTKTIYDILKINRSVQEILKFAQTQLLPEIEQRIRKKYNININPTQNPTLRIYHLHAVKSVFIEILKEKKNDEKWLKNASVAIALLGLQTVTEENIANALISFDTLYKSIDVATKLLSLSEKRLKDRSTLENPTKSYRAGMMTLQALHLLPYGNGLSYSGRMIKNAVQSYINAYTDRDTSNLKTVDALFKELDEEGSPRARSQRGGTITNYPIIKEDGTIPSIAEYVELSDALITKSFEPPVRLFISAVNETAKLIKSEEKRKELARIVEKINEDNLSTTQTAPDASFVSIPITFNANDIIKTIEELETIAKLGKLGERWGTVRVLVGKLNMFAAHLPKTGFGGQLRDQIERIHQDLTKINETLSRTAGLRGLDIPDMGVSGYFNAIYGRVLPSPLFIENVKTLAEWGKTHLEFGTTPQDLLVEISKLGDYADTLVQTPFIGLGASIYNRILGGQTGSFFPYFNELYNPNSSRELIELGSVLAGEYGLTPETGQLAMAFALSSGILNPGAIGVNLLTMIGPGLLIKLPQLGTKLATTASSLARIGRLTRLGTLGGRTARIGDAIGHIAVQSAPILSRTLTIGLEGANYAARNAVWLSNFWGNIGDVADAVLMGGDWTTVASALLFSPETIIGYGQRTRETKNPLTPLFEQLFPDITSGYRTVKEIFQTNQRLSQLFGVPQTTTIERLEAIQQSIGKTPLPAYDLVSDQPVTLNGVVEQYGMKLARITTPSSQEKLVPLRDIVIFDPKIVDATREGGIGTVAASLMLAMFGREADGAAPLTLNSIISAYSQDGQQTIDTLQEKGLVEIKNNQVTLTETGKRVVENLLSENMNDEVFVQTLQSVFDEITSREIDALLRTIRKLPADRRQALFRHLKLVALERALRSQKEIASGINTLQESNIKTGIQAKAEGDFKQVGFERALDGSYAYKFTNETYTSELDDTVAIDIKGNIETMPGIVDALKSLLKGISFIATKVSRDGIQLETRQIPVTVTSASLVGYRKNEDGTTTLLFKIDTNQPDVSGVDQQLVTTLKSAIGNVRRLAENADDPNTAIDTLLKLTERLVSPPITPQIPKPETLYEEKPIPIEEARIAPETRTPSGIILPKPQAPTTPTIITTTKESSGILLSKQSVHETAHRIRNAAQKATIERIQDTLKNAIRANRKRAWALDLHYDNIKNFFTNLKASVSASDAFTRLRLLSKHIEASIVYWGIKKWSPQIGNEEYQRILEIVSNYSQNQIHTTLLNELFAEQIGDKNLSDRIKTVLESAIAYQTALKDYEETLRLDLSQYETLGEFLTDYTKRLIQYAQNESEETRKRVLQHLVGIKAVIEGLAHISQRIDAINDIDIAQAVIASAITLPIGILKSLGFSNLADYRTRLQREQIPLMVGRPNIQQVEWFTRQIDTIDEYAFKGKTNEVERAIIDLFSFVYGRDFDDNVELKAFAGAIARRIAHPYKNPKEMDIDAATIRSASQNPQLAPVKELIDIITKLTAISYYTNYTINPETNTIQFVGIAKGLSKRNDPTFLLEEAIHFIHNKALLEIKKVSDLSQSPLNTPYFDTAVKLMHLFTSYLANEDETLYRHIYMDRLVFSNVAEAPLVKRIRDSLPIYAPENLSYTRRRQLVEEFAAGHIVSETFWRITDRTAARLATTKSGALLASTQASTLYAFQVGKKAQTMYQNLIMQQQRNAIERELAQLFQQLSPDAQRAVIDQITHTGLMHEDDSLTAEMPQAAEEAIDAITDPQGEETVTKLKEANSAANLIRENIQTAILKLKGTTYENFIETEEVQRRIKEKVIVIAEKEIDEATLETERQNILGEIITILKGNSDLKESYENGTLINTTLFTQGQIQVGGQTYRYLLRKYRWESIPSIEVIRITNHIDLIKEAAYRQTVAEISISQGNYPQQIAEIGTRIRKIYKKELHEKVSKLIKQTLADPNKTDNEKIKTINTILQIELQPRIFADGAGKVVTFSQVKDSVFRIYLEHDGEIIFIPILIRGAGTDAWAAAQPKLLVALPENLPAGKTLIDYLKERARKSDTTERLITRMSETIDDIAESLYGERLGVGIGAIVEHKQTGNRYRVASYRVHNQDIEVILIPIDKGIDDELVMLSSQLAEVKTNIPRWFVFPTKPNPQNNIFATSSFVANVDNQTQVVVFDEFAFIYNTLYDLLTKQPSIRVSLENIYPEIAGDENNQETLEQLVYRFLTETQMGRFITSLIITGVSQLANMPLLIQREQESFATVVPSLDSLRSRPPTELITLDTFLRLIDETITLSIDQFIKAQPYQFVDIRIPASSISGIVQHTLQTILQEMKENLETVRSNLSANTQNNVFVSTMTRLIANPHLLNLSLNEEPEIIASSIRETNANKQQEIARNIYSKAGESTAIAKIALQPTLTTRDTVSEELPFHLLLLKLLDAHGVMPLVRDALESREIPTIPSLLMQQIGMRIEEVDAYPLTVPRDVIGGNQFEESIKTQLEALLGTKSAQYKTQIETIAGIIKQHAMTLAETESQTHKETHIKTVREQIPTIKLVLIYRQKEENQQSVKIPILLGILSNDGLLSVLNLGREKLLNEKRTTTRQTILFEEGVIDLLESLEREYIIVNASEFLRDYRTFAINETAKLLQRLGVGTVVSMRQYSYDKLLNFHEIMQRFNMSRTPFAYIETRTALSGTTKAPTAEYIGALLMSLFPLIDDHIAIPLQLSSKKYSDLLIIEAHTDKDRKHIRKVKTEMLLSIRSVFEQIREDSPIRSILSPIIPYIDAAYQIATKNPNDPDYELAIHNALNNIMKLEENLSNFQASDQERTAEAIKTIIRAAVPIDALPQEMAWLLTRKFYEVETNLKSLAEMWSLWYTTIQSAIGEISNETSSDIDRAAKRIAASLLAQALSPLRTDILSQETIAARMESILDSAAKAVLTPGTTDKLDKEMLYGKIKELLTNIDLDALSSVYQWPPITWGKTVEPAPVETTLPAEPPSVDDVPFDINVDTLSDFLNVDINEAVLNLEGIENFLSDTDTDFLSGLTHTTLFESEFPRVRYPEAQQRSPLVATQEMEDKTMNFIFQTYVETAQQTRRAIIEPRGDETPKTNLVSQTTSDIRQVGYGGLLNSIVNTNGLMFHPAILHRLFEPRTNRKDTNIEVVLLPSDLQLIEPPAGMENREAGRGIRLTGDPLAIYSLLVMGIPQNIKRTTTPANMHYAYDKNAKQIVRTETRQNNYIHIDSYRVDKTLDWHISLPTIANTINAIRAALSDIRDDDYLAAPLSLLGSLTPGDDVSKGGILANLVHVLNDTAITLQQQNIINNLNASIQFLKTVVNAITNPQTDTEQRLAFILDNTYITQETENNYQIMSLKTIILNKISKTILAYDTTPIEKDTDIETKHTNALKELKDSFLENRNLSPEQEQTLVGIASDVVWTLATIPIMVVLSAAATTATQMISNGLPLRSLERGSQKPAIEPLLKEMSNGNIIELSTALAFKITDTEPYVRDTSDTVDKPPEIVLLNGRPMTNTPGETRINYNIDDDRPVLIFSSERGRRGAFSKRANELGDENYEIPTPILSAPARISAFITAESVARALYKADKAKGTATGATEPTESLGEYGWLLHAVRYGILPRNLQLVGTTENRYVAEKNRDIVTTPVILSFELHAPSYPRDYENPLKQENNILGGVLKRIYNLTKYSLYEPIITIQGALLRTFQKREGRMFAKEWLLNQVGDKSSLYTETSPASSKVGAWLYNTAYSLTTALLIAAAYSRYSINNDPGFAVMAMFSLGPIVGTALLISRSKRLKPRFKNTINAILRRKATLNRLLKDSFERINTIIENNPQMAHNTTEIIETVRNAIRNIPQLPSNKETNGEGFAGEVVPELFIENNAAFLSKFGVKQTLIIEPTGTEPNTQTKPKREEIRETLSANMHKLYAQAALPITGYILQPEEGDLRTTSYELANQLLYDTVRRAIHRLFDKTGEKPERIVLSQDNQVILTHIIMVNIMLKAFTDKHVKMTGTNLTLDTANYVRYILKTTSNTKELEKFIVNTLKKLAPTDTNLQIGDTIYREKSLSIYKNLPAIYVQHLVESLPSETGTRSPYSEYEILYGLTRLDHYTDSLHHNIVYHDREAFHKLLHTILLGREVATFAHVRDRHVEHPTLRYQYVISSQMGTLAPKTPPSFIANVARVTRDLIASLTDPFATLANIGLNFLVNSSPLSYSNDALSRLKNLPSALANSLINNKTLAIMLFGSPFIAPVAAHSLNISLNDISQAVPAMLASYPLKVAALITLGRLAMSAARTTMPSMGLVFSAMRNKIGEIAAIDNMRDLLLSRIKPAFVDYETYSPEEFTESIVNKTINTPPITDSVETSLAHTLSQILPQNFIKEKLKEYMRMQGVPEEEIDERIDSIPSPEVALIEINKNKTLREALSEMNLISPHTQLIKEREILIVGRNREKIKTKTGKEENTASIVAELIRAALINQEKYPNLSILAGSLVVQKIDDKFIIRVSEMNNEEINKITLKELINLIEDIYTGRFIMNGAQNDFVGILNNIVQDNDQPNATEIAIEAYNYTIDALRTLLRHIVTKISHDALETIENQLGGAIYVVQTGHTPSERYVLRNLLLNQLAAFGTPLKTIIDAIQTKPNQTDDTQHTLSGLATRLLETLEQHYNSLNNETNQLLSTILHAFEQRITGDEVFDQIVLKAINQTSEASALERTKRTEGSGEAIDRISKILLAMRIKRDDDQIYTVSINNNSPTPDININFKDETLVKTAITQAEQSIQNVANQFIDLFTRGLTVDENNNNSLLQFINKLHLIVESRTATQPEETTEESPIQTERVATKEMLESEITASLKLDAIEKYLAYIIAEQAKQRVLSHSWLSTDKKTEIIQKINTLRAGGQTGELVKLASGIVGESETFVLLATLIALTRHLRIALEMANNAKSRFQEENAPLEENDKILFLFESALMKYALDAFLYDLARLRSASGSIYSFLEPLKQRRENETEQPISILHPSIFLNDLTRNINDTLAEYFTYERLLPSSHLGLILSEALKQSTRHDLSLMKQIDEVLSEMNLLMLSDGILEDIRNAQNKNRRQEKAPSSINDNTRRKNEMLAYIRNISEMIGSYVGLMVLQAPRLIALRSAVAHRLFSAMLLAPGFAITGLYETINAAKNIAILAWMQSKRNKQLANRWTQLTKPTLTIMKSYLPIALVTFGLWALGLWTAITGSTPVLETPVLGTKIIASTNPKNEFTFGDIQLITENGYQVTISAPRTADFIAQLALVSSLPFTYGGIQNIDNTLSEIVLGPLTSVTKSRTVVGHTLVTGFNQLLTNHFLGKPKFEPVRPAVAWLGTDESIAPNWLERVINTAYVASFPIYYVSSFAESGYKGGYTQNVLFTTEHYALALINTAMQAIGIEGRINYNQERIDLPFAVSPTLKINRYSAAITNQYINEIAYDYKDNILLGAIMSNNLASYKVDKNLLIVPKEQSIYKEAIDFANAASIESKLAPLINTQGIKQQMDGITKDAQLAITLAAVLAANNDNRQIIREEYIGGVKNTVFLQDTNILGRAIQPLVKEFPDIFHSRREIEKYTSFLSGYALGDKITINRNLATERLRTWSEMKSVGYAMSASPIVKGNLVLGSVASLLQMPLDTIAPQLEIATLTPFSEVFFSSIYTATEPQQLLEILLNVNMRESDVKLLPGIQLELFARYIPQSLVDELKEKIRETGTLLKGGTYENNFYAVTPIRLEPIVREPISVLLNRNQTIPLDKPILALAIFKNEELILVYENPLTQTLEMKKSREDGYDLRTLLLHATAATARHTIIYEILPATTTSTARYAHPFINLSYNRNDAHIILNQTLEKVFRNEENIIVTTTGEREKEKLMQKKLIQDPHKPTNTEMHIVARSISYWQSRTLVSQYFEPTDRNTFESIVKRTLYQLRTDAQLTLEYLENAKQLVNNTQRLSPEEKTIVLKTIDATIDDLKGYLKHLEKYEQNRKEYNEMVEKMQRLVIATSKGNNEEWALSLAIDMYLIADYITEKERQGIKTEMVGYRVSNGKKIAQTTKVLLPYNNLHSLVSAAAFYQVQTENDILLGELLLSEEIPILGKIPTPRVSTIFP